MHVTTPDEELNQLVVQWLEYDTNPETKSIISLLHEKGDWVQLDSAMRPRISFGTAGLRAQMGPGFSCINDLTIMQTSQGLAAYVKEQSTQQVPLVVIGYDHRVNSNKFSEITADAFLKAGFKVFLFPDIVPTPLLAFSVLKLKADVGVMITASHNPKSDNGYKVYWSNGAQIVSPHDTNILLSIQNNLIPWPELKENRLSYIPDTLSSYLESLVSIRTQKDIPLDPPIVSYTAMHGVGYSTVTKAIEACKLPTLIPVSSQVLPDPDFPTAPKPNPEEAGAFDEAIKESKENMSTVIFSNDPDADRLSIAEKQPNGIWRIFTGDEVGIILASYLFEEGVFSQTPKLAFLNTIVSSSLLRRMVSNWKAQYPTKDIQYVQCLTGFKNLVDKAQRFINDGYQIALAYEEALGYMCGTNVMDKDGISALIIVYECLLNSYPVSYSQRLDSIYKKHGYLSIFNDCYLASNPLTQIPTAFTILSKTVLPNLKLSSNVVVDSIEDKSSSKIFTITIKEPFPVTICFRASGTEPKLKFYSQLGPVPYSSFEKNNFDCHLQNIVLTLIDDFLKPTILGLYPSSKLSHVIASI